MNKSNSSAWADKMILSGTTTDELPFGIDCIDCPQETEPGNTITNRLMGEKDRGDGMPVSPLVHETKAAVCFLAVQNSFI